MSSFDALITLAEILAVILCVALAYPHIPRRKRWRLAKSPEEVVETKLPSSRPIKELNKRDFQFLDQTPAEPLFIYSRLSIINPVTTKIVVQHGGALLFYGTATEEMVICAGGSAVIYGTVVGNVTNEGGELHVYGRIIGCLATNAGKTEIYATAQVLQESPLI